MLSRLSNKQQPKSADALKILPILKRIDFIELKSFKEFFEHHKDKPKLDQRLSRQVERFDLETKIHDSLFVMELLSRDKKLALTNEEKITL